MAVAVRERRSDGTFAERVDGIGAERWKSHVYQAWSSMKTRCTNPKVWNFESYGGRGITFDPRWDDYAAFHNDMAATHFPGASLDRINTNGNYGPDNCRWATPTEQANNKRNNHLVEYHGEVKTLPEWARQMGMKSSTIRQRYYVLGWPIERCIETPVRIKGGQ